MLVRRFHHGESVFDGMRHRFLAVDVFAGGAGVFEDLAVIVIHGGDQDGIDILAIKDRAIVACRGDARIIDRLLRCGVAAVVEIAYGDALNAGHTERGLEMFASADAGADRGEADGVAGRNWARVLQRACAVGPGTWRRWWLQPHWSRSA